MKTRILREYGLHRCMSKRFPFAIFYDLTDETIDIYAVLDGSDPKSWRC
jgi:hypothetical protein